MTVNGSGSYQVTSWDEKPYDEQQDAIKLTKAHFGTAFSGVIQGQGSAEYLMAYPGETSASFVGLQRVTGSVGGRAGSFVLQASGSFDGAAARAQWFVVPDSGTGELKGLAGTGGYVSGEGGAADITLDYDIS
ncbi:MAG TPA: DUF3224 domain-containing protein [Streptosporangiaceae bacterium]|jgi:hypothetical protein